MRLGTVAGMSEFSEWLTQEIDRRGLSLRVLADDISRGREGAGVKHTTIKSWQDGYAVPNWFNCGALADALGVSRDYVRRLAGYVDPDTEASTEDPEVTEILAARERLGEFDRQALIRFVRALRDSPTRRE